MSTLRAILMAMTLPILAHAQGAALPLSFSTPEFRTDIVPKPGDFTVGVLFRANGFGEPQHHADWPNGMVVSCESGYYDGFRLQIDNRSRLRPVFEIGRSEGAVQLVSEDGLAAREWHHVSISWQCLDPAAQTGAMRLFIDGQLAAESPADRPAPILHGAPLRVGYVDYGVGALDMDARHLFYEPRALSAAEVRAKALAALDTLAVNGDGAGGSPGRLRMSLDAAARLAVMQGFDDTGFLAKNGAPSSRRIHRMDVERHGGDAAAALEAALEEAAQAAAQYGLPQTVEVPAGTHSFSRTVEISGPRFAGIVVSAPSARSAVFSGATVIPAAAFVRAENPEARRLPTEEARAAVRCARAGVPSPRAYGNGFEKRFGLLPTTTAADADILPCAAWPETGFEKGTFSDGAARIAPERAARWSGAPSALAHGYWRYDWADAAVPVGIGPDGALRPLAEPGYGYGDAPRLRIVNLLEELDKPGEWVVENGVLYLWPKANGGDVRFPTLSEPFLRMRDCPGLTLENIKFRDCAGDALVASGCRNLTLLALDFRNIGGTAMVLYGADGASVSGCRAASMGHGGLYVNAGDRDALRGGGAVVRGCSFAFVSLLARTYEPAIRLEGCGIRVVDCSFEHTASSAMRIEGNDHLVEGCRFLASVEESDDQGAIDMWGDPTYRGCVLRGNFFSDVGGDGPEPGWGRAAIRLDDLISGVDVCGNVFENAAQGAFGAVHIHGGQHNRVHGNVFRRCKAGVGFSAWTKERWLETLGNGEIAPKLRGRADNTVWLAAYPELARLRDDVNVNSVHDNVFIDCGSRFREKVASVEDYANVALPPQ